MVEGGGLENRCAERHQGFKSSRFRHFARTPGVVEDHGVLRRQELCKQSDGGCAAGAKSSRFRHFARTPGVVEDHGVLRRQKLCKQSDGGCAAGAKSSHFRQTSPKGAHIYAGFVWRARHCQVGKYKKQASPTVKHIELRRAGCPEALS